MVQDKPHDFRYTELADATSTTRVVSVLPYSENGLIRILIRQQELPKRSQDVNTASSTPYRCLSYRWGPRAGSKQIYVIDEANASEGLLLVTPMLHDFLQVQVSRQQTGAGDRMAPGSHQTRDWWWIDSICIDQKSESEKPKQVQNMDLIYSKASAVFIWLGHEPKHTAFLSTRFALMQQLTNNGNILDQPDIPGATEAINAILRDERLHDTRENSKLYGGAVVSKFYEQNPYWDRLWIIQEVFLASKVFVTLADRDIPLKQYDQTVLIWRGGSHSYKQFEDELDRELTNGMYKIALRNGCSSEKSQHICSLRQTRRSVYTGAGMPFSEILRYVDDMAPQCAYPSDQVYGLLAMSDLRGKITVGNDIPVWQVFTDVCNNVSVMGLAAHIRWPPYKCWINLMRRMGLDRSPIFERLVTQVRVEPQNLVFSCMGHQNSEGFWYIRLFDNADLSRPTPIAVVDLHFFMAASRAGTNPSSAGIMCIQLERIDRGKSQTVALLGDEISIRPIETDERNGTFQMGVPLATFLKHARWIMRPTDSTAKRAVQGDEISSAKPIFRKKRCTLM